MIIGPQLIDMPLIWHPIQEIEVDKSAEAMIEYALFFSSMPVFYKD